LLEIIARIAPEDDSEEVLEGLLDTGMLIQAPHISGRPVWRTRMGKRYIFCVTYVSGCSISRWKRVKRWSLTIVSFAARAAIRSALLNRKH
jgi:hypothetical protein